jgi:glycosyltransferase involved in cell wall biosynthesis
VALEAALFNKPILCFDKSGGACELVQSDSGFVVPYLDTEAMAERVIDLLKNPHLRRSLGERAAEKTKQRHDVAVIAPQILKIIQRFLLVQTDSQTPRELVVSNGHPPPTEE